MPVASSLTPMAEEFDIATKVWKWAFKNGPYSSFHMVDAIANSLGLSYRDVLDSPEKLKGFNRNSVTQENLYEPPFFSAWSCGPGRCASFALKIAHCLEAEYPNWYCFKPYDCRHWRTQGRTLQEHGNFNRFIFKIRVCIV